jgi:predicted metal-binding protein
MNRYSKKQLNEMIDDDELFHKYDLGNMYSVCEVVNWNLCNGCNIIDIEKNPEMFYSADCRICRKCATERCKKHRELRLQKLKQQRDK